ncbi:myoneurin [Eurosta solidaginis]|uniref:myoneurin n=1 Tax=Eurosta solidaginis TaxID=178769 RepID=UPI003530F624
MDMLKHYTPNEEELLPSREIPCSFPNCSASFTNIGNLNMHIKRHHDSKPMTCFDSVGREYAYHCPQQQCSYHEKHAAKKHFTNLKYLRQHYQKMHLPKTNVCDRCGKGFITCGKLLVHMEKMCGFKYVCKVCGWTYDTMEALLTHGKRKGHMVRDDVLGAPRKAMQTKQSIDRDNSNQETQTEDVLHVTKNIVLGRTTGSAPLPCNQETQTDANVSSKSTSMDLQNSIKTETMHASTNTQPPYELLETPCDIETQTDDEMVNFLHPIANFCNTTPAMHTSLQAAQLLPPSIHTYTQTYDDLLTDSLLEFTDIQTQTNWSSFSDAAVATTDEPSSHQYSVSSAATCTRSYDELLVSTETQTSFTQCLLESRAANAETGDATFSNLYHTQHTQTCDMLLGALFGSQESDLIGGYQSTHTQT